MKQLLTFAVIALAVISSRPANAAPFETLGGPIGGGSNVASTLGLNITALGGLLDVTVGPAAITGTADADVTLDGSNDGTAQIFSTDLTLADVSGSASTILGAVNFDLIGVGINVSAGPIGVSSGGFTVDASTPGSLTLNAGTIDISGAFSASIDLGSDPISVAFADLGSSTLLGTADDSLAGVDTTAPGDEIVIDWNGANTDVDLSGITATITLIGAGVSIGAVAIPEPTSGLFLASLAAGACSVVRRRRS